MCTVCIQGRSSILLFLKVSFSCFHTDFHFLVFIIFSSAPMICLSFIILWPYLVSVSCLSDCTELLLSTCLNSFTSSISTSHKMVLVSLSCSHFCTSFRNIALHINLYISFMHYIKHLPSPETSNLYARECCMSLMSP